MDWIELAVAADHAGIALKQRVAEDLKAAGHDVTDLGSNTPDPLDEAPSLLAYRGERDMAAAALSSLGRGR